MRIDRHRFYGSSALKGKEVTMRNKNRMLFIALVGVMLTAPWLLTGCSAITAISHCCRSTDHFLGWSGEDRILYEPGAEAFAAAVAMELPAAVDKVQARQFAVFPDKIKVFVCNSRESFKNLTGSDVSAMCFRQSIFLSPKLMDTPDWIEANLAHELSHLLIYQQIGGYAYLGIPSWFAEGLAAYVSDGGGAWQVSDAEAREAIKSGNHFKPLEKAGFWDLFHPKYATYWGITHRFKHHMFYHQCMLFIAFLEKDDPAGFKACLTDIQNGMDFQKAFRKGFGADTMAEWRAFKKQITG